MALRSPEPSRLSGGCDTTQTVFPFAEMSQPAYRTSSLWRFLSEVDASGLDVAASPGIHPFDFSYLSRLLQTGPSERDCSTSGAPCKAEVQWLDAGLRSQLGKPLRELYSRFMQAYALYGEGRLTGSTTPDIDWLDDSFAYPGGMKPQKGCKTVKLAPTPDSLQRTMVIPRFEGLSTQCWRVDLQGFDEQSLSVAITTDATGRSTPTTTGATDGATGRWLADDGQGPGGTHASGRATPCKLGLLVREQQGHPVSADKCSR